MIRVGLALILGLPLAAHAADYPFAVATDACDSGEKWSLPSEVPPEWQAHFQETTKGKSSAAWGFSQALALRKIQPFPGAKALAEYWISRALFSAELYHLAHAGLTTLAQTPIELSTLGIHLATLECLAKIHRKFPTLTYSERILQNVFELAKIPEIRSLREPVFEVALQGLLAAIQSGAAKAELSRWTPLFRGGGAWEDFATAVISAAAGTHTRTVSSLKGYFGAPTLPEGLHRFWDQAHLLKARAHYSLGQYDAAIDEYKLVRKQSNDLAQSLSELAWAYLMAERYREAVGTAINLQSGGLRKTFAPEAPMIMSMALNEICQFPEAISAIQIFKKHYKESYQWLKANSSSKDQLSANYTRAIQFLKRAPGVPDAVGGEWVRSPLFLARQDELNLFFKEKTRAGGLGKSADHEQSTLATELLKFTREFKKRYSLARTRLVPGQDLPVKVRADLAKLQKDVVEFQRFRAAAPVWRTILANHDQKVPARTQMLISEINTSISDRNRTMLSQLDEIAENNYFIEVEIFNGASQDMIWQNAYPDYQELAKKMKDDPKRSKGSDWNWGTVASGLEGNGEIWEDELGSFKADLVDNCSSKEKYLALKRTLRAPANQE